MQKNDSFLDLKQGNYKIKPQQVNEKKAIIENRKAGRPRGEAKKKTSLYLKEENIDTMNCLIAGYPVSINRSNVMDWGLEYLYAREGIAKYIEKGRKMINEKMDN